MWEDVEFDYLAEDAGLLVVKYRRFVHQKRNFTRTMKGSGNGRQEIAEIIELPQQRFFMWPPVTAVTHTSTVAVQSSSSFQATLSLYCTELCISASDVFNFHRGYDVDSDSGFSLAWNPPPASDQINIAIQLNPDLHDPSNYLTRLINMIKSKLNVKALRDACQNALNSGKKNTISLCMDASMLTSDEWSTLTTRTVQAMTDKIEKILTNDKFQCQVQIR